MDGLVVWPHGNRLGLPSGQAPPAPAQPTSSRRHPSPRARCQLTRLRKVGATELQQRGQVETSIPQETRERVGSFKSPAAPGTGAAAALEDPRQSRAATRHLQPWQSQAGGEAGFRKPSFLPRSYTLNGRSQPGTADPG